MMEVFKPAFTLLIISTIAALCLGFVYGVTKAPIEEQKQLRETTAMKELLPNAASFEKLDIDTDAFEYVGSVSAGYDENGTQAGMIYGVITNGYGGGIEMLIGIDDEGVITGVRVVSHSETAGLGANAAKPEFYEQYNGKYGTVKVTKASPGPDEIEAISAATITSNAVTKGVNAAIEANSQIRGLNK